MKINRSWVSLALTAVLGLASAASAQVQVPGSYEPLLDAGSPLNGVTGTDNGWADLSLNNWNFPYFGTVNNTIGVNADGYLIVGGGAICACGNEAATGCQDPFTQCTQTAAQCGGGCCTLGSNCSSFSCGGGCCAGCYVLTGSAVPLIGPYNEDLTDVGVNGISYLQGVNDGGHYLTVDYNGVQTSQAFVGGGASSYQFQVTLQESGTITFAYGQVGPVADAGPEQGSIAAIGVSDPTGTFYTAAPCCAHGSCSCGVASWQPETVMVFDTASSGGSPVPPGRPYLVPQPVQLSNLVADAGSLSFQVSTKLLNVGSVPLTGPVDYIVYLAPVPLPIELLPACSGTPPCLGTFGPFQTTVAPYVRGSATTTGPTLSPAQTFTVANPPNGVPAYYYAEVWVDPAQTLGLENPRAAIGLSSPLPLGVDLTGLVGAIVASTGAAKQLTVPLTLENLGLAPSGPFNYQVYLTAAPGVIAVTDYLVPPVSTTSATVGSEGTLPVTFVGDLAEIPNGGVLLGDYYVTLSLPLAGDLNPLNNIVSSASTVHVSPAHLSVTALDAPSLAFIGLPTDVAYTLSNTGQEDAPGGDGGFSLLVLIHQQTLGQRFNRTGEPTLTEIDGISLKAGCTIQVNDSAVVSESPPGCAVFPAPTFPDGGLPARPVIPTISGSGGPMLPGDYLVNVWADPYRQVPGTDPNHPASQTSPTKTVLALPAPDFTVFAGNLVAPSTAVAGEVMTVQRTISNIGIVAAGTPYGYFLSAVGEVNQGGVPVSVLTADGGVTYRPQSGPIPYAGSGQPNQVTAADTLLIPSGAPAGTYTLTIAMDPDEVTNELSRANDLTGAQATIQVAADPLQVVTATRLPSAVVNVSYSEQLMATGGLSGYTWTLIGGTLPPGFTLNPQGALAGTAPAAAVGNYSLLVQVQSGKQQQIAALLLAITDASAPIQILTEGTALPPATVGIAYDQQLAAQGGVPPYTWSGTPPGGGVLALQKSGVLSGTPGAGSVTTGAESFTVTVTDQIGNSAESALRLQIVSPAQLVITTDPTGCSPNGECPATINPQVVGTAVQVVFTAIEGDALPHTFTWQFPAGQALPAGLSSGVLMGSQGQQSYALTGTPAQVGVYPFRLLVTDEVQHVAEHHFVLVVSSVAVSIPDGGLIESLPGAVQGQPYPATKLTTAQPGPITFALYAQDLPQGLSLSSDGTVSGTCAPTADARPYVFVLSATDSAGNQALLPYVISVAASTKSGCSTGGGTSPLLVALFLLGWAGLRRRRLSRVALLVALGGFVAGSATRAQATPQCGYRVAVGSDPYVDITGLPGVVSLYDGGIGLESPQSLTYTLPFALPMPGQTLGRLYVWTNGALQDIDVGVGAQNLPTCPFPFTGQNCSPPYSVIAPWWGDLSLCPGATLTTLQEIDDAGLPSVTIQWANLTDDQANGCKHTAGASAFSFQTKISQTGNLEYIYGPATIVQGDVCAAQSATCHFASGVESGGSLQSIMANPVGSAALACDATCQSSDFPTAAGNPVSVELLLEPDLQATTLGVGANVSVGAPAILTIDVLNAGASPVTSGSMRVYYSADGVTLGSPVLAAPIAIQLGACAPSQPLTPVTFTLPVGTTAGVGFLIGVIADPSDTDPIGKTIVSSPFAVLAPEPHYTADHLTILSPTGAGAPGASVTLTWTAQNPGAAAHPNVPYSYYLSRATTVTPSDLALTVADGGVLALNVAAGATTPITDVLAIPSAVPPGSYTVGVIIDPNNTFAEQSRVGAVAIAPTPLLLVSPTLAVATTVLPPATLGSSYSTVVLASGGDGTYNWAATGLPQGLALSPAGEISGSPTLVGTSVVTLIVTDGQSKTGTAQLSLVVTSATAPLAIVTAALPGAQVNSSYQLALTAVGGTPPYTWCGPGESCASLPPGTPSLSGVLPPGLLFSSDGVLAGVPGADGTFAFEVAVTDSATPPTTVVSANLPIHITASGSVSIVSSGLPVGQLGAVYRGNLGSAGGTPPVTWALLDCQRLPSTPGGSGSDLLTSMPAGLTLELGTGQIVGTPLVSGRFVLLLEVTDSSSPMEVATDNVLLQILPSDGLRILNTSLPNAAVSVPYSISFDTNVVDPMAAISFVPIDTAGHDTPAARATLPPGLTLSPTGQLTGSPTFAGSFTFLIEASASDNRSAIQAFNLIVGQKPSGGCSAGAGETGWIAMLGVLALWRARRR